MIYITNHPHQCLVFGINNEIVINSNGNIEFIGDKCKAITYFINYCDQFNDLIRIWDFLIVRRINNKLSLQINPSFKNESLKTFQRIFDFVQNHKVFW